MFETFCGYLYKNNFNIVIIKNSLTKTNYISNLILLLLLLDVFYN